jgi:flavin reductase (DIM6/NTAB) family NADH-FMN oxidoreductase RutF
MPRTDKRSLPPDTALYPVPIVLVSCGTMEGEKNLVAVAWTGTLCSDPPCVGVSLRRSRHSHGIVSAHREFVVNVPDRDTLAATDWCGTVSGRDVDKFARTGLTPVRGDVVQAPLVDECPLSLECRVRQVLPLGSHDLFVGEVVRVHLADGHLAGAGLSQAVVYAFSRYLGVGAEIAPHGFALRRY